VVPLQTPIAASAPSASAPATPAAPVATATLADLASQTAAQVGGGASQFQITLTPEGLGQVSVTVNVAAEGKVTAAFSFEKPETADALSGRASDLQKALEQAGFSLSDTGLSFAVATPTAHGQGAGADQNPGGTGQGANQGGGGQGSSQGGSGQGDSGQGSNQGSNAAFAQTSNPGSGQGDGGAQGRSWTYSQAAGRAFATASDAAATVDQSPQSPYASRSASGLDIRI
jgi:flagellar hook-length control protein FliK